MGGGLATAWLPVLIQPRFDFAVLLEVVFQSFPVESAVFRLGDICEDGILLTSFKGNGIRLLRSSGSNAKESVFGVNGTKDAILIETHPGDVITYAFDLVSGQGWLHHCQIGLATGGRESGDDVSLNSFWIRDAKDQHMFSEPAFTTGQDGAETKGETFLAEE